MPQTRYARSGDLHIAYQVVGDGPIDLLYVQGLIGHVEWNWQYPASARFLERLASFSRLIVLDRRGTGLSDRATDLGAIEDQVDDLVAVMDDASSERAALLGVGDGGLLAALFAATYPERTRALITFSTRMKFLAADDYPWGLSPEQYEAQLTSITTDWGTTEQARAWARRTAPSHVDEPGFVDWYAQLLRLGGSPGTALALLRMWAATDARPVLPVIRAPTLVLWRTREERNVMNARYIAEHVPNAKAVELPGTDSLPWAGDSEAAVAEIQEFLTGIRPHPASDRVLATVLFTDFVRSTERNVAAGDRAWTEMLDRYDELAGRQLERFRGRLVHTRGDGLLATFDGPARAIHCAVALRDGLRAFGVECRTGLHTGEVELRGEDVAGVAVNIGSRVMELAGPGEILVSGTVADLVVGSGIDFADRGTHELRGVPGARQLFEVKG